MDEGDEGRDEGERSRAIAGARDKINSSFRLAHWPGIELCKCIAVASRKQPRAEISGGWCVLCTQRRLSSSSAESQFPSAAEDDEFVPRVHLNYSGILVIAISSETGGQCEANPGLAVRRISRHVVKTPLGFHSRHSPDSFPFPLP